MVTVLVSDQTIFSRSIDFLCLVWRWMRCGLRATLLRVFVFFFVLPVGAHANSDQVFSLPANIKVIDPAADVPQTTAGFSGAWVGDWVSYSSSGGSAVRHILIVEDIQSDSFRGIYAVASGQANDQQTLANWARVSGSIKDGVLEFRLKSGASVSYKVGGPDELQGTLISGSSHLRAKVSRSPVPAVNMFQLVPLPADVSIEPIPSEKPEFVRKLQGVWVGWWGGTVPHILVIEKVSEKGLEVVYASGTAIPARNTRPLWRRVIGQVENDQLVLKLNDNFTAVYRFQDNGELLGSINPQKGGSTTGSLHKSALP